MKTLVIIFLIGLMVACMISIASSLYEENQRRDELDCLESSVLPDHRFILVIDKYRDDCSRYAPYVEIGFYEEAVARERAKELDSLDKNADYLFGLYEKEACYEKDGHFVPLSSRFDLLI